tara:strand:- start:8507 stop:9652 length:1146 start_codon:yes stop_codon:yes gene_type:complete
VDALITMLYQSSLDISSKPILTTYPVYPLTVFMKALCERLGCVYVNVLTGTDAPNFPICESRTGMSDDKRDWFANAFIDEWDAYPFVAHLKKPGECATLREACSIDSYSTNQYYKNFLQRLGVEHEVALRFQGPFGEPAILSVLYKTGDPKTDQFCKTFLQQLAPHLEISLAISMKVRRSELVYDALRHTIDSMAITSFVLDGKKRVIDMSNASDGILDKKDALRLSGQRLHLPHRSQNKLFQKAIEKCIAWRRNPLGSRPAEVFRVDSQTSMNLGLLVQPTPYFPYRSALNPHAVVYLSDAERKRPAPERLISQLLGVGPREAHLSILLANGHDLKKAAELMGVTETTARTYLQRIYSKTSLHSQIELVELVLKSVAILA